MPIEIVNPVGGALGHYTTALHETLQAAGVPASITAFDEPSVSGRSARAWLAGHCRALSARPEPQPAHRLVTWPVAGYLDFALVRLLAPRVPTSIVVHDPMPLVRAIGYGRTAATLASLPSVHARPIVHSEAAQTYIATRTGLRATVLPHPVRMPQPRASSADDIVIIRVLGQFKAARDLEVLRTVRANGPTDWRYEIIGRGWPSIEGWTVDSRYVSNREFEAAIASATVVLIPYRTFFQSGVAIRCLEMGVPFVGPAESSLSALVGDERQLLVGTEAEWLPSIMHARSLSSEQIHRIALENYQGALRSWREWASLSYD